MGMLKVGTSAAPEMAAEAETEQAVDLEPAAQDPEMARGTVTDNRDNITMNEERPLGGLSSFSY